MIYRSLTQAPPAIAQLDGLLRLRDAAADVQRLQASGSPSTARRPPGRSARPIAWRAGSARRRAARCWPRRATCAGRAHAPPCASGLRRAACRTGAAAAAGAAAGRGAGGGAARGRQVGCGGLLQHGARPRLGRWCVSPVAEAPSRDHAATTRPAHLELPTVAGGRIAYELAGSTETAECQTVEVKLDGAR